MVTPLLILKEAHLALAMLPLPMAIVKACGIVRLQSHYTKIEGPTPSGISTKVEQKLAWPVWGSTFLLPLIELQKDTVILPGMEGLFGIKANHVAVISQLKPGVVELHAGAEVEKYFISGGWAYVHPDGITDIQALEIVTLDQVDHAAVKAALSAASSATATDDYDAAVNRTALDLYSALDAALEQKS